MYRRIELLKRVVRVAGDRVLARRRRQIVRTKKNEKDIVTQGDLESEKIIVQAINSEFPKDKILSEEIENKKSVRDFGGYLWVIDPIDGTNHYFRGQSYWGVSIGLIFRKEPVAGVVYQPSTNELFYSEKGKGSYLNGQKITCSSVLRLKDASLMTGTFFDNTVMRRQIGYFTDLNEFGRIFITGSAAIAICEVAAGRIDLYLHTMFKPWDAAAAFIIASEAGAVMADLEGNSVDIYSPEAVVANPKLLANFLQAVDRQ